MECNMLAEEVQRALGMQIGEPPEHESAK
jgi:hypothetical protein